MNWETVTFIRIYLTEADRVLQPLLEKLHDQEKVRGVTVFRAMSGFGGSGVIHTASLLDLSLDLPVTVEFFDSPDKVDGILEHLSDWLESGHIVRWQAQMNTGA
jgi:PII-like signaling protein